MDTKTWRSGPSVFWKTISPMDRAVSLRQQHLYLK
jgi:hypothetical protein